MCFAKLLRITFLILLLLLKLQELKAQSTSTQTTFRTSAEMVLIPVTVTDHNGKTIEGLQAQNFTIHDDQKSQHIASFVTEDSPCSVGVVIDISGSMQNILSTAKDVARAFLGTANPDDDFLLLTVSTQPEAISGFTTDVGALEKELGLAKIGGLTALIDTIYLSLNNMRKATRPRRALLILSDGGDNHSRYSRAELIRVALEADVQVYTIVFDNPSAMVNGNTMPFHPSLAAKPWDQARQRQGPQMLAELSAKTGGLHFLVHKEAEAKEAAVRAGRAIRNEYVIGYQPADVETSGKWHRVRVKSDVPQVNVHARAGYYSR
jgi:Ca-activated chloride channel family protein